MANILIAWEMGAGWGHLVPLRPVINGLVRRGHTVVAVMRDLARAGHVFAECPARLLPAPMRIGPVREPIRNPNTFAQLLHDAGYADELELRALARAWRTILEYVKPDLLIADHSPTALLASRGLAMRRAVMGFGFICPPDQDPLPNLRFWTKPDPERLARDDAAVLLRMNRALEFLGEGPIQRVTQIYGEVDATFLTTFKELDHFPWREGAKYWGAWTVAGGRPPQWPEGTGRRIYAYLKDCLALGEVLRWLGGCGRPTIAFIDTQNVKLLEEAASPTIRFERERLDMAKVARQCDLAVLHAPHGTTAAMLLAGKPVMLLPNYLEQGLMGHAVCRMGAGEQVPVTQGEAAIAALEKMLGSNRYAAAARGFAERYEGYDPVEGNERVLDAVEEVLFASESLAKKAGRPGVGGGLFPAR